MTMTKASFRTVVAVTVALTAMPAVVAPASAALEDALPYIEDGRGALLEGDLRTALIQFKRAAREAPTDPAIRYDLATIELRLGDFLSAELNFRAAEQYGLEQATTRPMIAWAMLYQGKYEELLEEIEPCPDDAACKADVLSVRARASLMLEDNAAAEQASQAAIAAKPDSLTAMDTRGYVLMLGGNDAEAEAYADDVLASDPDRPEALILKGDLRRKAGRFDAAVQFYNEAIRVSPGNVYARIQLATTLFAQNKVEEAVQQVEATLSIAPNSVAAIYVKAFLQARTENMGAALETLRRAEVDIAKSPRGAFLLSVVNLANDNPESAYQYAVRFHADEPDNLIGVKLLANAALRLENHAKVVSLLEPRIESLADDPSALNTLGAAYLALGRTQAAQDALSRSLALKPESTAVRGQLALLYASQGDTRQAGIDELEDLVSQNPEDGRLTLALIAHLYGSGDYDRAAKAATQMIEQAPADPRPYSLRGVVRRAMGDVAGARSDFTEALDKNPRFVPAALNLAELTILDGRVDDARAMINDILAETPGNLAALVARARIEGRMGNIPGMIPFLEKAVEANPDALEPWALMLEVLPALDPEKAILTATDLARTQADNLGAVSLALRTLYRLGEIDRAVDVLTQLGETFPDRAEVHISAGQAFLRLGRAQDAVRAYDRAIDADATSLPAWAGRVQATLQTDGLAAAQDIIEQAKARVADSHAIDLLGGDLLFETGHLAEAQAVYDQILRDDPRPDAMGRVFRTLVATNQRPRAHQMMKEWLASHPDDRRNAMVLANDLLAAQNYAEAAERYEALTEDLAREAALFNNLAYAYDQMNDPRALETAQRAFSLAPSSPNIADTYGYLLYRNGKVEEGAALLRRAHEVAPNNPGIAYHFAKVLTDLGQTAAARAVLKPFMDQKVMFGDVEDARALYARLGGEAR